jgi:hypothetical protein
MGPRRWRDFTISTQRTAGRRHGGARALSYVLKGSQSAHFSRTFSVIQKIAGLGGLQDRNRFHFTPDSYFGAAGKMPPTMLIRKQFYINSGMKEFRVEECQRALPTNLKGFIFSCISLESNV